MRLILLTSHARTLINFRLEIIKSLISRGHSVFALAPDFDSSIKASLAELGVRSVDVNLSRTGLNPITDVIDVIKMIVVMRKIRPNLIFSYSTKPVIYGSIAAFLSGIPQRISMIEGLGYAFTDSLKEGQDLQRFLLKKMVSVMYKLALNASSVVLFLNNDDMEDFVTMRLVDKSKCILYGGIGVDLDYWRQSHIKVNPLTFIMTARILREKGIYEFVEAAEIIKKLHPGIRFVIIGDTDSNPGNIPREKVVEWVDSKIIEWPGYVDTREWLQKSSVFVLPSYREGVPRSSQEALAIGLPIITTDVPGCRDTVVDGLNGFLIPSKDSKSLVAAMRIFIANPDLIPKMGAESRKLAVSKFDVKEATSKLVSIIESY